MPVRAAALALICLALAPEARAAAFDDLKADLAECLRFERDGAQARRAGVDEAVRRCAVEIDRLDRADPRRLPGDRGLSPSSRSVLQSVLGSRRRSGGAR